MPSTGASGSPLEPFDLAAQVERAAPGDTVRIPSGVHRPGRIVVDKKLVLMGIDWPILDGDADNQILTIHADSVVVTGLIFRNVSVSYVEDRAAIKVDGSIGCSVSGNRFEDTFFAIYLARSADCVIEDNVITGQAGREAAAGNGIHAWYCRDLTIRRNRIRGHRDGIYLEFVEDAVVEQNNSGDNLRYGLHFMFSDRCVYVDNVFRANSAGVAVMYTDGVEMRGNTFADNWGSAAFGLLLKEIDDSVIEGNLFIRNTVGLHAEGADRSVIERNEFAENGWAMKLLANCTDNLVRANNFRANTFDVATNSRSSFSVFKDNFWDRYRGYDLDKDGVGDVPFRPVSLFSMIVERHEPSLILLRSFLVDVLDLAERVAPSLTPEALADATPRMSSWARNGGPNADAGRDAGVETHD
jgi:nitrous oxidase accessory protein